METQNIIDDGYNFIVEFAPKILAVVLIWIIGSWIIKILQKAVKRALNKTRYDLSLKKFSFNIISWALKVILVIIILGAVGIETASFTALIAAAGFAIGMALQGSLANFAGGALIMIFKPFKVGDLIEAQGETGVVKEIEIFTTKLADLTNREVIIPNGILSNGNIVNHTSLGTRRVDLVFGVSYDTPIHLFEKTIMKILTEHPKILQTPKPTINVIELAESSVNFAVRPWCESKYYWDVYFEVTKYAKLALDAAGIEIPYPHSVEIQKEA